MKRFVCMVYVLLCFLFCKAQTSQPNIELAITTNKTTSVIFPYSIKHVDRGTKDLLVQQVSGAENLLLVKASIPRFKETNLSVVTADGQLYSFTVTYDSLPAFLVYRLAGPSERETVTFKNEVLNPVKIEQYARTIIDNKKSIGGIRDKQWDVLGKVNGIYVSDRVLFYQLVLNNQSAIDYDIDFIRFYIRDKNKSKRTASQELELKPLCIVGNIGTVKGNSENKVVVALEKFTIPDAKFLAIEIMERNGGRHLLLKIKNNKLIKAKKVEEFPVKY